jgi:hypothetical protein
MSVSVEESYTIIRDHPDGVMQSELWKILGVDSRKCSRIVKKLIDSGLIERIEHKHEGIKTYLLIAKRGPVNPAHILAGDELVPCIACEFECVVEQCPRLLDWMYQLAITESLPEED